MKLIIAVGHGKYRGRTNAVLQRAVDDCAAAGGGTVEIPAGLYRLTNSLFLRSGVNIIGDGRAVLEKVPSVSSPLADYLGYGHYEVTVTQPAKFKVGMGVRITDQHAFGFYNTVATITGQRGNVFFIDHPLHHDYGVQYDGQMSTLFPLLAGYQVRKVTVRGLVLDGNPRETRLLDGCRGGGVFLLGCHQVRLERLEVRRYFGDAISFQQSADTSVTDCDLHHNRGSGLHPGSGSVRYVMRGNRCRHNTGWGLFYCLRTQYSLCEENLLEANGRGGISIGERDTHHLIRRNVIRASGGPGIEFRKVLSHGGDDVVIADNRLENNGRREIVLVPQLRGVVLSANTINGRRQPRRRLHDRVGPLAAPSNAVRHLSTGRQHSRSCRCDEGPRQDPVVAPRGH